MMYDVWHFPYVIVLTGFLRILATVYYAPFKRFTVNHVTLLCLDQMFLQLQLKPHTEHTLRC